MFDFFLGRYSTWVKWIYIYRLKGALRDLMNRAPFMSLNYIHELCIQNLSKMAATTALIYRSGDRYEWLLIAQVLNRSRGNPASRLSLNLSKFH